LKQTFRIRIQRYLCKITGKTFSCLPSFLDKHSRYTLEVIGFCLLLIYHSHLSISGICRKFKSLSPRHNIARSTIRNWQKRFEVRGREGVRILSEEFFSILPGISDAEEPPINECSPGEEFIRIGSLFFQVCRGDRAPPDRLFEFLNLLLFDKTGRGLLSG
jgi:hypothetical protein